MRRREAAGRLLYFLDELVNWQQLPLKICFSLACVLHPAGRIKQNLLCQCVYDLAPLVFFQHSYSYYFIIII